jgi:hypothetical protein
MGEGDEGDKPAEGETGRGKRKGSGQDSDLESATPRPVIPSCSTVSSVAQLEALLRVHIMMAQLHGLGSQLHFDLSMSALAYCSLIWKVCYYCTQQSHHCMRGAEVISAPPCSWCTTPSPSLTRPTRRVNAYPPLQMIGRCSSFQTR